MSKSKSYELLVNDEIVKSKIPVSEGTAILYYILSGLFYSITVIIAKDLNIKFPTFNIFVFTSFRFFILGISAFINLEINNEKVPLITKDKWFILHMKTISSISIFIFSVLALKFIRLGTCLSILNLYPIWSGLFAYIVLNEKLSQRFFSGSAICFAGAFLLTMNENTNQNDDKSNDTFSLIIGVFCSVISSISFGYIQVLNRQLVTSFSPATMNYILGLYTTPIFMVISIFTPNFNGTLLDFYGLLYSILNGIFTTLSIYLQIMSFKHISVLKVTLLAYLQLIFTFFGGILIFSEDWYFLDILGIIMIIGFNIYDKVVKE